MKKSWLYFITPLFLLITSSPVFAELVTIEYQATVDWVDDSGNALNGTIVPGQIVTGSYTFDTNLSDNNPDPGFAEPPRRSDPYGRRECPCLAALQSPFRR